MTKTRRAPVAPDFTHGLNQTERGFIAAYLSRKPTVRILRSGWPDFLFEHNGRTYGVEVKSDSDVISGAQRAMFAALERAGIKTYVWSPKRPAMLVFWRRWRAPTPATAAPSEG